MPERAIERRIGKEGLFGARPELLSRFGSWGMHEELLTVAWDLSRTKARR